MTWSVNAGGFSQDGGPSHALPADVTIAAAEPIGFTADGSSSGGQIILNGGHRQVAIQVDWLTGRVGVRERN